MTIIDSEKQLVLKNKNKKKKTITKRKSRPSRFKTGFYKPLKCNQIIKYRSSWELELIKKLDINPDVISFEYETLKIPYILGRSKKVRYYIPDFLIIFKDGHKELWEVKPKEFIEKRQIQDKKKFAESYCLRNNILCYKFITKEDLKTL